MKELGLGKDRFIDDHFDALGLDPFHDALDAGGPEVVGTDLHDEAIDADHFGVTPDDLVCDEVLARCIGLDNSVDEVLRHVAVVGQQLLASLGRQ